MVFLR